jgi:nucleoside 2-deoxyribosyltransferase
MKIYLAARFPHQHQMQIWAKYLESKGHTITSLWIYGNEMGVDMTRHDGATMDLDHVNEADVLLSEVLPYKTPFSGGGRHVEFGYALAKGKILINVGDGTGEHIFHHLKCVKTVGSIEQAVDYMAVLEKQKNFLASSK